MGEPKKFTSTHNSQTSKKLQAKKKISKAAKRKDGAEMREQFK